MRYTVGYDWADGSRSVFAWFTIPEDAKFFLEAVSGGETDNVTLGQEE